MRLWRGTAQKFTSSHTFSAGPSRVCPRYLPAVSVAAVKIISAYDMVVQPLQSETPGDKRSRR